MQSAEPISLYKQIRLHQEIAALQETTHPDTTQISNDENNENYHEGDNLTEFFDTLASNPLLLNSPSLAHFVRALRNLQEDMQNPHLPIKPQAPLHLRPQILASCRQIHTEALPLLYATNTLIFDNSYDALAFLSQTPRSSQRHLRHLGIHSIDSKIFSVITKLVDAGCGLDTLRLCESAPTGRNLFELAAGLRGLFRKTKGRLKPELRIQTYGNREEEGLWYQERVVSRIEELMEREEGGQDDVVQEEELQWDFSIEEG